MNRFLSGAGVRSQVYPTGWCYLSSGWMKSSRVTIQMEAIKNCTSLWYYLLHRARGLHFSNSRLNEIPKCDHLNEGCWVVHLFNLGYCLVFVKGVPTLESL